MTLDDNLTELEGVVSKIKHQNRLKIIGFFLIPVLLGGCIIKKATQQKRNLTSLKEGILDNVEKDIKMWIVDTRDIYGSINDTYLTYHARRELIEICDSYLDALSFLKSNKVFFQSSFNQFVVESSRAISLFKKNVVNFSNEYFVERRMNEYGYLFNKSPFPLDDSQKKAVIIDDTHNLVVAGAGSGKTEVLITRVAYLIERKPDGIDPERILVLAYQNKAAEEIRKRLKERFDADVGVKTFHSFGLQILKQSHKDSNRDLPDMQLIGDNFEAIYRSRINSIYIDAQNDADFHNDIINYMKSYGDNEIAKPETAFEKKEEYYKYMRNLTYKTLNGKDVKSEAERAIMNFFITHYINGNNIKIHYESPAEWMKYIGGNGEYNVPKPDFFLPDYDLYLEHWGIDKNGKVPEWFEGDNPSEKYNRGMNAKKKAFGEQSKYSFVETTHWEFKEKDFDKNLQNKILGALKEKYSDKEFEILPVPYEKLINKVWKDCQESVKRLPLNIGTFITIAKTYSLSPAEIEKRLFTESWSPKQKAFNNLAIKIYDIYEKELRSNNQIDFSDMINLAAKELKQNENLCKDAFDHILIDEYQDISAQRYELIKSLMNKNSNCKIFCVGDDWQSIMGFAGSDLDFFVNFSDYFDHPARTDLTVNYRSVKSIVDTGAEIIKQNGSSQLKKKTTANDKSLIPVKVYSLEQQFTHKSNYNNQMAYYDQMVQHCVNEIETYCQNGCDPADIMILGRIVSNIMFKEKLLKCAKINGVKISTESRYFNSTPFMSVHRSKGLQAKVVFIVDVVEGLYGFPSELENPDIFEPAIKGRRKDKEEEERRLFYVAITRAKEEAIIYTQEGRESKFLDEINEHVIFKQVAY